MLIPVIICPLLLTKSLNKDIKKDALKRLFFVEQVKLPTPTNMIIVTHHHHLLL